MWWVVVGIYYLFLFFLYGNQIPIWDGEVFFNRCIVAAVERPFALFNFNCGTHLSFSSFFLVGWPQYIWPGQVVVTNLVVFGLAILAILSLNRMLKLMFSDSLTATEITLLTILFAVEPAWVGNLVNLNLDTLMTIWLVFLLYSFVSGKKWLTLTAGTFFVFTKPQAIIWYAMLVVSCLFIFKKARTGMTALVFPVLIFGLVWGYKNYLLHDTSVWAAVQVKDLLPYLFKIDFFDPGWSSYLAAIFILNWHWVMSGVILFERSRGLLRMLLGSLLWADRLQVNHWSRFFVFGFIFGLYLFTSFRTHTNPRYFLTLWPFLLVLFSRSLGLLIYSSKIRQLTICLLVGLSILGNFFTIDPVSRRLWGTWKFGSHDLLKITSISGECCGWGRDQIIYNLQYTFWQKLKFKLYGKIHPDKDTIFVAHSSQRQLDYFAGQKIYFAVIPEILALRKPPAEIWYVEFPNVNEKYEWQNLLMKYELKHEVVVNDLGYALRAYKMILR